MSHLKREWEILHRDIERYEYFSLTIKLFSLLICVLSMAFLVNLLASIFIVLVLWLQNGIWNTFQGRLESRILIIEQKLKTEDDSIGFQLYSEWQKKRLGGIHRVKEYAINSLRPTVAYPYILLVFILLIVALL